MIVHLILSHHFLFLFGLSFSSFSLTFLPIYVCVCVYSAIVIIFFPSRTYLKWTLSINLLCVVFLLLLHDYICCAVEQIMIVFSLHFLLTIPNCFTNCFTVVLWNILKINRKSFSSKEKENWKLQFNVNYEQHRKGYTVYDSVVENRKIITDLSRNASEEKDKTVTIMTHILSPKYK